MHILYEKSYRLSFTAALLNFTNNRYKGMKQIMDDFLKLMGLNTKTSEGVKLLSPLKLAYLGDVVYEVYIRSYILNKYRGNVNELHRASTKFVKAGAQAYIIHTLENELSQEEWNIVKRGRNQKSNSVPKNAHLSDYKYATGFEALIGYLYLQKKYERVEEIIIKAIEIINQMEK